MPEKSLPKGAIANMDRKQVRINLARQALKHLSPTVKFKNRTEIFEYIASSIRTHEKLINTETKKGPCSRSGVYSVTQIKLIVEKFWLTGVLLDDDIDLHETVDAAAQKKLMDYELEISNLRFDLKEKSRFLNEADEDILKLKNYIESQDISDGQSALEYTTVTQHNSEADNDKVIEALCQAIFKLECWGAGMIERNPKGAFIDLAQEEEIASKNLLAEYIKRVTVSRIKE